MLQVNVSKRRERDEEGDGPQYRIQNICSSTVSNVISQIQAHCTSKYLITGFEIRRLLTSIPDYVQYGIEAKRNHSFDVDLGCAI